MSNKFAPFIVAASLLLNGCANNPNDTRKMGEKAGDAFADVLIGTLDIVAALTGGPISLPKSQWYKALPRYATDVAPYVLDQKRFESFMNRYKERGPASEEESLAVIYQLGVYNHANGMLRPETVRKIDQMLTAAKEQQKMGLRQLFRSYQVASTDRYDSSTGGLILSDAIDVDTQIALAPAAILAPEVVTMLTGGTLFGASAFLPKTPAGATEKVAQTAAIESAAVGWIFASSPKLLMGVIQYFTDEANAKFLEYKKDICNSPEAACTINGKDIKSPVTREAIVEGAGTLQPCTPPEGTMCYVKDTTHDHAGRSPHWHKYTMARLWSSDPKVCQWQRGNGKIGDGVLLSQPNWLPCSKYPNFIP